MGEVWFLDYGFLVTGPTRTDFQREYDYLRIANLYLRGHTQFEIGQVVGVHQTQISQDLKILHTRWLKSGLRDFDELKGEQLAKLDKLETEYWEGWERSKGDEVSVEAEIEKGDPAPSNVRSHLTRGKKQIKNRDGNPVFLNGVLKCVERRCAILGLDAPLKVDLRHYLEQLAADHGLDVGEVLREADRVLKDLPV